MYDAYVMDVHRFHCMKLVSGAQNDYSEMNGLKLHVTKLH